MKQVVEFDNDRIFLKKKTVNYIFLDVWSKLAGHYNLTAN